jgi:hypothetical protein
MTEGAIDVDVDELDAREVPVPHHSWSTAQRVIREACAADEHDWAELTGLDEPAYWRECKTCGIADVTAAALGQDVETPNADPRNLSVH